MPGKTWIEIVYLVLNANIVSGLGWLFCLNLILLIFNA